jgi:hypothetical protein
MRPVLLTALALISSLGLSRCALAQTEIPLKDVWAHLMRGTRDIRELSKEDIAAIRETLSNGTQKQAEAGPCFIVFGDEKEALRRARKMIVDDEKPVTSLRSDGAAWLVFYSYAAPGYVCLESVSQSEGKVIVQYEVLIHATANATQHFALIPLGKLPAGELNVEIAEVVSDTPYSNHEKTERSVCDSCTFVIEGGEGP